MHCVDVKEREGKLLLLGNPRRMYEVDGILQCEAPFSYITHERELHTFQAYSTGEPGLLQSLLVCQPASLQIPEAEEQWKFES
jgi:hypothetical protein